ncbi:MAG: hypothetical protein ACE5EM_01125 [Sphingomonadales bacterium]
MKNIRVECYAGYRGEQTPRRFILGDQPVEIAEIVDCWLAPDHRYFKVRSRKGSEFLLRHDEVTGQWDLVMYKASGARA